MLEMAWKLAGLKVKSLLKQLLIFEHAFVSKVRSLIGCVWISDLGKKEMKMEMEKEKLDGLNV